MIGEDQIELLRQHPEVLEKICRELERKATVVALDLEVRKMLDHSRSMLTIARQFGRPTKELVNHLAGPRVYLTLCAMAIGRERGRRLGRVAAHRIISEADAFATAKCGLTTRRRG